MLAHISTSQVEFFSPFFSIYVSSYPIRPVLFPFFQAKEPKINIKIDVINATFQPAKVGNPNGLQITYLKDNKTRNIFVYHENGKVQGPILALGSTPRCCMEWSVKS